MRRRNVPGDKTAQVKNREWNFPKKNSVPKTRYPSNRYYGVNNNCIVRFIPVLIWARTRTGPPRLNVKPFVRAKKIFYTIAMLYRVTGTWTRGRYSLSGLLVVRSLQCAQQVSVKEFRALERCLRRSGIGTGWFTECSRPITLSVLCPINNECIQILILEFLKPIFFLLYIIKILYKILDIFSTLYL